MMINGILKRLQGNKSFKGKKVHVFYLKTFFKSLPSKFTLVNPKGT